MATIEEIRLADDPHRWAALGFAVEGDRLAIGAVELRLAGSQAGTGITGWTLRGIETEQLDGLPTRASLSAQGLAAPGSDRGSAAPGSDLGSAAPAHPNGVVAIDHVVAVSPAFERTVAALRAAGLDLRRIREEPTPAGAPRQAFFRLGAEILELVAEPDEVTAAKGGPERPARFWGLALLVEDLDATVAAMQPHAGAARAAVQPGRRIATLARSVGLSAPVALISAVEQGKEASANV